MPDSTAARICDFCGDAIALLFCRADDSKLCFSCDREVHATNQLFSKHTRWLLCDVCHTSSALIFCTTHGSALCHNCDFELHTNSCSSAHDRRPLEGFSGRPSVSEIASFLGLEWLDCKSVDAKADVDLGREGGNEGLGFWGVEGQTETGVDDGGDLVPDFWAWETIASQGVVSINDLILSSDEDHGFQATVDLNSLPKDRNSACGQHKQEMIRQLCKLGKSEPGVNQGIGSLVGHQTTRCQSPFGDPDSYGDHRQDGDHQQDGDPGYEECWNHTGSKHDEGLTEAFLESCIEEVLVGSNVDSDLRSNTSLAKNEREDQACNMTESMAPSRIPNYEFNSVERGSALSRYKEKKRNRRYEKHVRYESRKALAESRMRVKGRFAKIDKSTTRRLS